MQLGLPKESVHTCSHTTTFLLTQPAVFRVGTPVVAELVAKIAGLYNPELDVGYTAVRTPQRVSSCVRVHSCRIRH